jgi:hypothetical protein
MAPFTRSSPDLHRAYSRILAFALLFLVTFALWTLFVATSNHHELFVGLLTSLATAIFLLFVHHCSPIHLKFRARDLLQAWRIPWYIANDTFVITAVLIKDLLHLAPARSYYRVSGFDSSLHDPVRAARSILAVAYTTASPNSIVIGIDPAQSRMLFHQLQRSSTSRMTRRLGAKS